MFKDLKIKNEELKNVVNAIENLTPWDREALCRAIVEQDELEEYVHKPATVDEALDGFSIEDVIDFVYDTDNFSYLAKKLNSDELNFFVRLAIGHNSYSKIYIKSLLNYLYENYNDDFNVWLENKDYEG